MVAEGHCTYCGYHLCSGADCPGAGTHWSVTKLPPKPDPELERTKQNELAATRLKAMREQRMSDAELRQRQDMTRAALRQVQEMRAFEAKIRCEAAEFERRAEAAKRELELKQSLYADYLRFAPPQQPEPRGQVESKPTMRFSNGAVLSEAGYKAMLANTISGLNAIARGDTAATRLDNG